MNILQTGPITYTLFIEGTPAPGGSKTAFPIWRKDGSLVTKVMNGRVWPIFNMVDAGGERNAQWKKTVAAQGRAWMKGRAPFSGPVKCEFVFCLRRPLNHYRSGRNAELLAAGAPEHHTQKPDALKFARSTEDALTGILWHDDCQTIRICSEKRWAARTEKEGVAIKIIVQ